MAEAIAAAAAEVAAGRLRRPVPDRRVPDRLRHLEQHERQRGASPPSPPSGWAAPSIPNDHVNASQSSNDVFPSVDPPRRHGRRRSARPHPRARRTCRGAGGARRDEFADVVKSGRTHLMDATPVTLGQEFGGYAAQVRLRRRAAEPRCPAWPSCPLGGTAVGTGINTPPGFAAAVIDGAGRAHRPAADRGARPLRGAGRPRRRWSRRSGQLRTIAVSLYKIANDLRWMGSGRAPGCARSTSPTCSPGSSIMPGKVNPVIPEAVSHGVRPGHRQRRRDRVRRRGRQLRAERHAADDGAQPARVDPAAGQRHRRLFADRCVAGIAADVDALPASTPSRRRRS